MRHFISGGLSTAVWKEVMDLSGGGRSLAVNSLENMGKGQVGILQLMSKVDDPHESLYLQVIDCLKDSLQNCTAIQENNFFWRSDYMIHRTNKYYLSVRTHSRFIQSTESGIGQNLSGAYLADGATYIYQSGKEYNNILPIWNWHRIPGVTSYVQQPLPTVGWNGLPNESNFVGGVSDSKFGVSAMHFKRDGLTAYKAWFFGANGVVCLGAGINSNKNTEVSTTVNQCFLSGEILAGNNAKKIQVAEKKPLIRGDINWVYHGNTGYVFGGSNKIHVSSDLQKGSWRQVHTGGSSELISGKVFNLSIDHGNSPVNASYAYAIYPGMSKDSVAYYAKKSLHRVLRNDSLIQAVQFEKEGIVQAVCYSSGKIAINKVTEFKVDAPCIAMIKQKGNNYILTVSSPPEYGKMLVLNQDGHPEEKDLLPDTSERQSKRMIITLNGHFKGEHCVYNSAKSKTEIVIELPNGSQEGKSVEIEIEKL